MCRRFSTADEHETRQGQQGQLTLVVPGDLWAANSAMARHRRDDAGRAPRHRRTDLSTFVIHWTRDYDGVVARDNLLSILESKTIEARNPWGLAKKAIGKEPSGGDEQAALDSQKAVCFTEAPLEQAWSLVGPIKGRTYKLAPFGLAFTKHTARAMGVNPIWYIDATPGHDWLTKQVDLLVDNALQSESNFADNPLAKITPFMDVMGTWDDSKKEFWWEREWRHLGDLRFSLGDVAVVFCPESEMRHFDDSVDNGRRRIPMVDPKWGLEHIIAELVGVPPPYR